MKANGLRRFFGFEARGVEAQREVAALYQWDASIPERVTVRDLMRRLSVIDPDCEVWLGDGRLRSVEIDDEYRRVVLRT